MFTWILIKSVRTKNKASNAQFKYSLLGFPKTFRWMFWLVNRKNNLFLLKKLFLSAESLYQEKKIWQQKAVLLRWHEYKT